jgi:hypothetical protein
LARDESSRGETAHHSLPNDSGLLAALPFALRAASMIDENPQAANSSASSTLPAMKGPKSGDSDASLAAGAKAASVGRLVGERAFHFGPSTFTDAIASRTLAVDSPLALDAGSAGNPASRADLNDRSALAANFSLAETVPTTPSPDAGSTMTNAKAAAPIVSRSGASPTNRANITRAAAHSGQKPGVLTPPPLARVAAAAPAPAGSSEKSADGRPPDPGAFVASPPAQTDQFGGQLSAPFAAGTPFQLDGSTASAGHADVAPRASTVAAGSAPSTSPIKEIDVDLSSGGLEDVSMTMRLAGDKLSVVIRASSSQTLGSIEGARDAIADRLAAIGQPLDSLIVKQTGVNTDGNTNGNGSSADGGSKEGEQRSAYGGSERDGSNDALSRRGAGRDRSF